MLRAIIRPKPVTYCYSSVRLPQRPLSSWAENAANPKYKIQTYLSTTTDPYLNLSIEQYLLERTPTDSCILFTYINRPCVVIGRNQNPWLEVNLSLLQAAPKSQEDANEPPQTEPYGLGKVDLVRRRSGGGAVFHDEGNVNWSIICPSAIFTRDKHAEMIVRALRQNGIERARVNERHDIVLDQGSKRDSTADSKDLHRTPFTVEPYIHDVVDPRPVKVSGSAYKLTRGRALHHGTCLLSSPNLQVIPHYLHSPARGFIKAKGVESVSSPVSNIGMDTTTFRTAVRQGFEEMYAKDKVVDVDVRVGERALEVEGIKKMWEEMQTLDWTYSQTPQFTFSTIPIEGNTRKRAVVVDDFPSSSHLQMDFKHGQLLEASYSPSGNAHDKKDITETLKQRLSGNKLYEAAWRWEDVVEQLQTADGSLVVADAKVSWLKHMLPSNHIV